MALSNPRHPERAAMRPQLARHLTAAVLLVPLLAASGARADAPWSAPATVTSGTYQFCCRPSALTFTGDGHALAALGGTEGLSLFAAEPGVGAFTQIGRAPLAGFPAVYGRRGVAYLRTVRSSDAAKSVRLDASLGRLPGSIGHFRPLARIPGGDVTARLAADRLGDVAAAWLKPRRGHGAGIGDRVLVRVALRPAGHAFGRAQTIGEATIYDDFTPLDVAYGANGDLVIAYQNARGHRVGLNVTHRDLRLTVRVKRHGAAFGPVQTLGPVLGFSSVSTAVSPTGRAVVPWATQDGGEGVEEPWRVRAAVLRAGARHFSKAQTLDPGRVGRPIAGVRAAVSSGGSATVFWSGVAAGSRPFPVRVATAGSTGRFGAKQQLSSNGTVMGVVAARDGSTTVLWGSLPPGLYVEDDPVADQLFASHRPSGATAFASPEPLSSPASVIPGGALAIDPRSGHPAALWISGSSDGDIHTALYSTRSG
jgi:hypothetical protein